MEQKPSKALTSLEIDEDTKRWLELKVAERFVEGRPFGERSMGAVIRDILTEQRKREEQAA